MNQNIRDFIESVASSIDGHRREIVRIVSVNAMAVDLIYIKSLKDQRIIAIEIPEEKLQDVTFIRNLIKSKLAVKES